MNIIEKSLNYIKSITAETIANAKVGSIGSSLGGSSILFALFKDHYNYDVSDTDFLSRDRFVLSAGHVSPLYYTLMSVFGYDISLQDLKDFNKLGSKTPLYPEFGKTDGVETSTAFSGQGISNAVGMAIAEKSLSERFNAVGFPIIDNYTYCYASDGDIMEGLSQEACSLAGNLKLSKLILLYDCNEVTVDGTLSISSKEDIAQRFKAMDWNVISVKNGNSYLSCTKAIAKAKKSNRPTIIIFKTLIGVGTDKEGTSSIHGYIPSDEEITKYKKTLKVKDSFFIPADVREFCMASSRKGKLNHEKWNQMLAVYATSQPELYKEFVGYFDKKKFDFEKYLKNEDKFKGLNLINVNEIILNDISEKLSQLIGGTADSSKESKIILNNSANFLAKRSRGRNIHFGIREHAMAGIVNGIALYEDFVAFDSTELAYATYMFPAIKMRALMQLPIISFFTNDSIYGEGGYCQPIEQLGQLRSIKGLNVFRPCDANELIAGYKIALSNKEPTAIILAKQNFEVEGSFKDSQLGGYILKATKGVADVVLYATGSEVKLALEVAKELEKTYSISVVSIPCIELFEKQSIIYKSKVLQKQSKIRVAIEASNDNIWFKYLNDKDIRIGVEDYTESASGEEVYSKAGFNIKNIVKQIQNKMKN